MYLIMSSGSYNGQFLIKHLRKQAIRFLSIDCNPHAHVDVICPSVNHPDFKTFLAEVFNKYMICQVIPCSDHDLKFISKNYKFIIESLHSRKILIPPKSTLDIFMDKSKAIDAAKEFFPKIPRNTSFSFVRNRFSYSRPKFSEKITNSEIYKINRDFFRIDPFISGVEYSVDSFMNESNQTSVLIRQRLDIVDGVSRNARFINDEKLEENVDKFLIKFKVYGFANTQFISKNNKFHFIECNTRPGGGIGLSVNEGLKLNL